MAHDFVEYPKAQQDDATYEFTAAELAEIDKHIAKYPDKRSAVMPALWIAQEKWGWLPQGAMQLVAKTLDLSYAHVYGVATFYTMYLKERKAKHLVEVCTCFTCGVCGGKELFENTLKKFNANAEGVTPDGEFYFREAECLGACDTPPIIQVDNDVMIFNGDESKMEKALEDLRAGKKIEHEVIPLADQSRI